MILLINGHEYTSTEYSDVAHVILVHKTVEEMTRAYTDFRVADTFELNGEAYTGRTFTGANLLESGANIQATYNTIGIDQTLLDKANGYDVLMGGE